MRVFCKSNKSTHLPASYGYRKGHEFPLVVGKNYGVYAMIFWTGRINYLIFDESRPAPFPMPSELFEIVDSKLSRHWHFNIDLDDSKSVIRAIWGYKELTDNPTHYEQLLSWNEAAFEIFACYKEAMDLEFPNPDITDVAEALEGGWFFCPKCNDAWESQLLDALVKCPSCGEILRNPKYSPSHS
jgi:hypothetical protein